MGGEKFEVDEFAFIGRTYEEYVHMFDLDEASLEGKTVLDCPSGPDSFVATAHDRGVIVTGADVLYDQPPAALRRRCRADFEAVAKQLPEKRDLFDWSFYGDVGGRKRYLRGAYEAFLDDYAEGRREGRYVYADLPTLPFASDSFSLVLSAHFLFLYGDRLDYEFHLATLREFLRVARDEVRVFPLVGLDTTPYERLDDVVRELRAEARSVDIVGVPFEFQQGADEMLVVTV